MGSFSYDPTLSLIKEIFAHPICPTVEIDTIIEEALLLHNQGHYASSIEKVKLARKNWRLTDSYNSDIAIFFKLQLGDVLESAKQDKAALAKYLEAKQMANISRVDSEAMSVIFHKIACLYYHMEEFKLAREYFVKTMHMREEIHRGDNNGSLHCCDCAAVYNNYAVCIDRQESGVHSRDALDLFLRAFSTFKTVLGPNHPRTIISERNIALEDKKNEIDYGLILRPLNSKLTTQVSSRRPRKTRRRPPKKK